MNITSLSVEQFLVYLQLSSQKIIKSWNSELKLSHKVVYDFKSAKYVGIFDNRFINFWREDEPIPKQSSKEKKKVSWIGYVNLEFINCVLLAIKAY